jgi:hypothetical protein
VKPEGSLSCSQKPANGPYPEQRISPSPRRFETFRNNKNFYGEGLLAQRPTPKLEDHALPAVRGCLFNIFAATLRIWRPSLHPKPEDALCRGEKGPAQHGSNKTISLKFTNGYELEPAHSNSYSHNQFPQETFYHIPMYFVSHVADLQRDYHSRNALSVLVTLSVLHLLSTQKLSRINNPNNATFTVHNQLG